MIKLAHLLLHTLSKPVLALVIGLVFCTSAYAGNASIGFAAYVPAHSKSQSVQTYPQTVVSFSAQAILPVQHLMGISTDLRVFDDTGNWIQGAKSGYFPVNGSQFAGMLVNLNGNSFQTFTVCAGSKKNCVRYTVNRL